MRGFVALLEGHRAFLSFVLRHFVFTFGLRLATPLFPLWYVREAGASDSWVGIIGMASSLVLLFGYNFWRRQSRRRSMRALLIATTVGAAMYPVLLALTTNLFAIVAITAYGAAVYAGIDLVLFDLLMRTIPQRFSVTLTSVETSVQNLASIVGPLLGGVIADRFGIAVGLVVAGAVTLAGAVMFVILPAPKPTPSAAPACARRLDRRRPPPKPKEADVASPTRPCCPTRRSRCSRRGRSSDRPSVRRRGAASLRRLENGRLLMAFLIGTGPDHVNDGAVMLTHSDDEGATWDEPFPVYAVPGWDSLPLGGIAHVRDDLLHLVVGRVKYDPSLGRRRAVRRLVRGRHDVARRRPLMVRRHRRDPAVPDVD